MSYFGTAEVGRRKKKKASVKARQAGDSQQAKEGVGLERWEGASVELRC